jgi:hypothetical protein
MLAAFSPFECLGSNAVLSLARPLTLSAALTPKKECGKINLTLIPMQINRVPA